MHAHHKKVRSVYNFIQDLEAGYVVNVTQTHKQTGQSVSDIVKSDIESQSVTSVL